MRGVDVETYTGRFEGTKFARGTGGIRVFFGNFGGTVETIGRTETRLIIETFGTGGGLIGTITF